MEDYSNKSKEELLQIIKELDTELEGKKYGLIWDKEKEPEQVVVQCDKKFPILERDETKDIFTSFNDNDNILIEGDNFHALSTLFYTHEEKIDIIYIDPPYNTGNKDFMYNDRYVDKDDGYRHSKWLNFMKKRLELSRSLLKDDGLIFISIGDDEQAQLKLLCDKIFFEKNCLACVPRVAKKTSDKGNYFKPTKDYVLVYAKNKDNITNFGISKIDDIKKYKFTDANGKYKKNGASLYQPSLDTRPNQRYYIECPDGSFVIPPGNVFPTVIADASFVKPINNDDKVWRWSYPTYLQNKDKLIFCKSDKTPLLDENGNKAKWNIYDKVYLSSLENAKNVPEDIIYDFKNSAGTKCLLGMGLTFSFSKPFELIKYLIEITEKAKDITVLDFFAGSGSTGHAVLKINSEDKGKRKFILCTNNENNICNDVTLPRIEKCINGYTDIAQRQIAALGGNLKYFKTNFVDNSNNRDQLKYDLTEKCIPMLCVKESTYNLYKESEEFKIYSNNDNTKFTCVYYDIFGTLYNEFIDEIKNIKEDKALYIFSLNDTADIDKLRGIKNYTIEAIPHKILDIYRKIAKLSKGG
ncbi:MAG: site-specific DNA-methyltransferase [Malacoplasma sp.]